MSNRALLRLTRLAGLIGVALLLGCQSGGGRSGTVRERLDEESSITVLTDVAPIVFARTETRYSRSERDYVYLGPVETNRQGSREYYLWVGIATTLDRGYIAPTADPPDRLFMQVQGEIMELPLRPWSEREPRLEHMRIYRTAVELQAQLAARVTLNQLTLLAGETLESLRVADGNGNARLYSRWDDQRNWPRFVAAATGSGR